MTVTPDGLDEEKIDVKDVSNVSILGVGTSGSSTESASRSPGPAT
ncbi:hypothetical protein NKH18_44715 [Streptomyces sp. M10(2022)]